MGFHFVVAAISADTLFLNRRLIGPGGIEVKLQPNQVVEVALENGIGTVYLGQTKVNLRVDGVNVLAQVDGTPAPIGNQPQTDLAATSPFPPVADQVPQRLQPQRFVIQGFGLNPAQSTLSPTPIAIGGEIASIAASYWQTATLSSALKARDGIGSLEAEAGTRLYRVENFTPGPLLARKKNEAWCGGDLGRTVWGTRVSLAYCLTPGPPDGVFILEETTSADFAADLRNILSMSVITVPGVRIVDDATPISPTFQIAIKLRAIKRDVINVEFIAQNGRQSQSILRLDVPRLESNGVARLPLWSHALELSVSPNQQEVNAKLVEGEVVLGPVDLRLMSGQQISPWTGRPQ